MSNRTRPHNSHTHSTRHAFRNTFRSGSAAAVFVALALLSGCAGDGPDPSAEPSEDTSESVEVRDPDNPTDTDTDNGDPDTTAEPTEPTEPTEGADADNLYSGPQPTSNATEFIPSGDPIADSRDAYAAQQHLADEIETAKDVADAFVGAYHTFNVDTSESEWADAIAPYVTSDYLAELEADFPSRVESYNRDYPDGWDYYGTALGTSFILMDYEISAQSLTFQVPYTNHLTLPDTPTVEPHPVAARINVVEEDGSWVVASRARG